MKDIFIKFLKPCRVLYNAKRTTCECCGPSDWWESYETDVNEEIREDLVEISGLIEGEDYEIIS